MAEENIETLRQELAAAKARILELEQRSEELEQLKDALRASENRYKLLFEYTGTAMLVIDEDTTVLMGNHKLEEITGFSQRDVAEKRSWTEVIAPGQLDKMLAFRNKRLESPDVVSEYEFRFVDKKGRLRDMLANIVVIPGTRKSLVSLVDVTSLKRTERALLESERRYKNLFRNANDIIFTIDLNGMVTSANIAALKTFKYNNDEFAALSIKEIVDPAYHDLIFDKLRKRDRKINESHVFELLAKTKSGEPVWVEVSTRLIRESDHSIGIQGIARDITERKNNQEQLQESRFRFKEIADLLPGIICEFNMGFNLTYVNEMGFKTFGFSREDFARGINVLQFIPSHMVNKIQTDIYNIFHGDYGNPVVYEFCRMDKSKMHALINSAPIMKNGTNVGVRSCIIDITETVDAEERLRISEARFQTIYNESPIGIALFDEAGTLVDRNNSFHSMFFDTLSNCSLFDLFDNLALSESEEESLRRGEYFSREVTCDSKLHDGGKKHCAWYVTRIKLDESDKYMFLAQVQDITERKIAQEQRIIKEQQATARAEALVAGLRKELRDKTSFNNMVSRSQLMKQVFEVLPEVARTSATTLVLGESGTGKEVIARSLHELSERKNKSFVAINCSALPDTLLESELFGYKAGAFTDAKKDKPGKFALAEGGTLFLDEIGDISSTMQVKLLRVLQERVYEPLGGTVPVKANVRVIVATNKNLAEMVKSGQFREDLYYRINVVSIKLPPLRDRRCDIPLLVDHFIDRFNARYNKQISGIDENALFLLLQHEFPGNIRELENIIEHSFIFCKSGNIRIEHFPAAVTDKTEDSDFKVLARIKTFDELERMYIQSILSETEGNKILAAERLGIHKATLFRRLKQLGIK
ncbi:MAG TPA: sigma 54-interacting transcriptional regulator [Chitinispirillaceae bacterium]|nr:sigma 54-interacting transcriptional regulator [Chitinispirillaceae bacterium]